MYDVLFRNTVFRLFAGPCSGLANWSGPGEFSVDGISFSYTLRREAELILDIFKDGVRWGTAKYSTRNREFKGRETQTKGYFALRVIGSADHLSNFLLTGVLPSITQLPEMNYTPKHDSEVFITTDLLEGPPDRHIMESVQVLAQTDNTPTIILDRGAVFKEMPEGVNVSRGSAQQGDICSFFQTLEQFFAWGGEYATYATHRMKVLKTRLTYGDAVMQMATNSPYQMRSLLFSRKTWDLFGKDIISFCCKNLCVGDEFDYLKTKAALDEFAGVELPLPISISGLLKAACLRYNVYVSQSVENNFELVPCEEVLKMKGNPN